MSRQAKTAIVLPKNTEVKLEANVVKAKGPKGNLELTLAEGFSIKEEDNSLFLVVDPNAKIEKPFLGLYWALLRNVVLGVSEGYEKKLSLIGVGYKAAVQGNKLDLKVGYSHPTVLEIPQNINVKVDKSIEITISGVDKQLVGQFAAEVRAVRKPEPYKGKGIRYKDEYVRRKAGKAAKGK